MKRMYSAVPGRVYVATRGHSASGDRELSLNKGDKVKGEKSCFFLATKNAAVCHTCLIVLFQIVK